MALRIPPGRAGRTWLVQRLEIARRGSELLDRKRQALLREQAHIRAEVTAAERAWREAAGHAARWGARAALLDGAGRLELLARHVEGPATLTLSWTNLMGARIPSVQLLAIPPQASHLCAWRQLGRSAGRNRIHRGNPSGGALCGSAARRRGAVRRARPRGPPSACASEAMDPRARAGACPARPQAGRESTRASSARPVADEPRLPPRTGMTVGRLVFHREFLLIVADRRGPGQRIARVRS